MRDETSSSSSNHHQQSNTPNMEKIIMMSGVKRSRDHNESNQSSLPIKSASSTSPASSSSSYSSYSDESESPPTTSNIESTNELHFSILNKFKNKGINPEHSNHLQDHSSGLNHQLMLSMRNNVDSGLSLMRSSSNASSTSSGVSTASSSGSVSSINSSNFNLNDSVMSSNNSTTTSLLNENHFKALIRSAQAAAASVASKPSQNNLSPDASHSSADVEATKFGLGVEETVNGNNIVRSRSSSLSESSTTSAASSSSNSYNDTSTHMNATLMKQLINSYNQPHQHPHNITNSTNKQLSSSNESYVDGLSVESHSPLSSRKLSFTSSSSNNIKNDGNNITFQSHLLATSQSNHHQQQSSPGASNLTGGLITGQHSNPAPCKVCGDEASGFHYGVDSCEGCKGFFRRCITQGMNHQCTNNQQCEMTPFSRNSCQFCRLKKCFAVGMSREASRLGRRPKRAKDEKDGPMISPFEAFTNSTNSQYEQQPEILTPLKQISNSTNLNETKEPRVKSSPINMTSASQRMNNESKVAQLEFNNFSTIPPPFKLDSTTHHENNKLTQKTSPVSKLEFNKKDFEVNNSPSSLIIPKKNLNKISSCLTNVETPNLPETTTAPPSQVSSSSSSLQTNMLQIEIMTKLISITDRHTSIERTNELEFIRTTIIESHCHIWPTTFEKIRRRYAERPPIRAPFSSSLKPESNLVLDNFVEAMVPLIMDVVKYCKYIPGFNQIVHGDQVQLLKQGSFEVICVNSFMLVDAQNKLMLTPDMEFLMDFHTVKMMPLGFFMSEVFELGIQVSPLKLTDSEIALFNAILIMNPDRGDLQDKDYIDELHSTLLHVLYKHLKYCRPDGIDIYYKMLKLIPIIQEINRKHSEALNTVKMSPQPNYSNSKSKPTESNESK